MDYSEELEELVNALQKERPMPDYFVKLFAGNEQYKKETNKKKKVGIIGDEFYCLYARAFGLTPIFLNGGSFSLGENASHIFPQISDPVAKSTLGFLFNQDINLFKELDAIIISASNDSYKKLIYYLKELNITLIEVEPPSFLLSKMPMSYVVQQFKALNALSKINNTRLSYRKLKRELCEYKQAYALTQSIQWKAIPRFVQDFFLQTLYLDDRKDLWCKELEQYLNDVHEDAVEPLFLLLGSHIQFPNSKIYTIFNDIGITHFDNQCLKLPNFQKIPLRKTSFLLLYECFKFQYMKSFTAQTLTNQEQYVFSAETKGIIYYLLKGQISEAYEAEQIEKMAIKYSIPFLCVETDYTNTDNEQIKIRVEAFYEMIKRKNKQSTIQ